VGPENSGPEKARLENAWPENTGLEIAGPKNTGPEYAGPQLIKKAKMQKNVYIQGLY